VSHVSYKFSFQASVLKVCQKAISFSLLFLHRRGPLCITGCVSQDVYHRMCIRCVSQDGLAIGGLIAATAIRLSLSLCLSLSLSVSLSDSRHGYQTTKGQFHGVRDHMLHLQKKSCVGGIALQRAEQDIGFHRDDV